MKDKKRVGKSQRKIIKSRNKSTKIFTDKIVKYENAKARKKHCKSFVDELNSGIITVNRILSIECINMCITKAPASKIVGAFLFSS